MSLRRFAGPDRWSPMSVRRPTASSSTRPRPHLLDEHGHPRSRFRTWRLLHLLHPQRIIERVNLDGSDRRTVVPRGALTTGKQLTADFEAGLLYWCDREGMQVLRCRLDGSGMETPGGGHRCAGPAQSLRGYRRRPGESPGLLDAEGRAGRRPGPVESSGAAPSFRRGGRPLTVTTSSCCGRTA